MNPYDFVCIDWGMPPVREKPIWHNQLADIGLQKLYSGQIEMAIKAETPLLIKDPYAKNRPAQSLRNRQGEYIIPGSSLKGMLRNVVETLGRGCLTLFDGNYTEKRSTRTTDYKKLVPSDFLRCTDNNRLCLSCRIFGMMRSGKREDDNINSVSGDGKNLFLGKINIGDARAPSTSPLYKKIYTLDLMGPQPHHDDFYLDRTKQKIAGRKYYFHHAQEPVNVGKQTRYNYYIQPLDMWTTFQVRLDFTALTTEEFAALLLAITLEEEIRHKIGYAKPLGLGSASLNPQSMILIDYASRYTQPGNNGKTEYAHDAIVQLRDALLNDFKKEHLVERSLQDLRRIWRWPADQNSVYDYPDYTWFHNPGNYGKRIAQTP